MEESKLISERRKGGRIRRGADVEVGSRRERWKEGGMEGGVNERNKDLRVLLGILEINSFVVGRGSSRSSWMCAGAGP